MLSGGVSLRWKNKVSHLSGIHVMSFDEVNEELCAGPNLLWSMHKSEWDAIKALTPHDHHGIEGSSSLTVYHDICIGLALLFLRCLV